MPTAADIIAEARTWVGTPFAHQQAIKGVGVDCVNFIAEVAKATAAVEDVEFESNYRRSSSGETLLRLLRHYELECVLAEEARAGDLLVTVEDKATAGMKDAEHWHVIVMTSTEPYWRGVHASRKGVREHRLDMTFKRRIHSAWRLRGLQPDAQVEPQRMQTQERSQS
jgi:hypothetical protein